MSEFPDTWDAVRQYEDQWGVGYVRAGAMLESQEDEVSQKLKHVAYNVEKY